MASYGKKRRAAQQLSPYTQDVSDGDGSGSEDAAPARPAAPAPRAARAVARRGGAAPVDAAAVRGIFGGVSFGAIAPPANDLLAGLNNSLLRAVTTTLDRQSNKDLTPLFRQYEHYLREIQKPHGAGDAD